MLQYVWPSFLGPGGQFGGLFCAIRCYSVVFSGRAEHRQPLHVTGDFIGRIKELSVANSNSPASYWSVTDMAVMQDTGANGGW